MYIWGCLNETPEEICNSNIVPYTNLPLITLIEIFSELSPVAFHSPQTPKTDIHRAFPRYLRLLYRYIGPLYRYGPLSVLTRIIEINSFHPKIRSGLTKISKREQLTQWTRKISMHLVTMSQEKNFQHFSWKKKKKSGDLRDRTTGKEEDHTIRLGKLKAKVCLFFPFISLGNRENKRASKKEGAQLYSVQGCWGFTQIELKQISTHFLSQVKSELGGIHSIDYSR